MLGETASEKKKKNLGGYNEINHVIYDLSLLKTTDVPIDR